MGQIDENAIDIIGNTSIMKMKNYCKAEALLESVLT